MANALMDFTLEEFINWLKQEEIKKAWWVYDFNSNSIISSHKQLEEMGNYFLANFKDFEQHEGIFIEIGSHSGLLQGAFIHNTNRGQAQGGTRLWYYDKVFDFFFDGIRLSRGMSYKNSLAGLWWGGGKGVIGTPMDCNVHEPNFRRQIFEDYGRFISSLKGCYITAEDVGTVTQDMDYIFSQTRYITCIPQEKGGSGNPSILTALGVLRGMEGALSALGLGTIEGKTVVVQGAGNVASYLIDELQRKKVGRIITCDIFDKTLEKAKDRFNRFNNIDYRKVDKDDLSILAERCDILAPCATGGVLNDQTIPGIKAKIICGAANNQLQDEIRHSHMLKERQIVYVPDFLTNRMGIVNCANEQYGYMADDPVYTRHLDYQWENSVYILTKKVVHESHTHQATTLDIALRLAREKAQELHPIWPDRSRQIIRSLMDHHWA